MPLNRTSHWKKSKLAKLSHKKILCFLKLFYQKYQLFAIKSCQRNEKNVQKIIYDFKSNEKNKTFANHKLEKSYESRKPKFYKERWRNHTRKFNIVINYSPKTKNKVIKYVKYFSFYRFRTSWNKMKNQKQVFPN